MGSKSPVCESVTFPDIDPDWENTVEPDNKKAMRIRAMVFILKRFKKNG